MHRIKYSNIMTLRVAKESIVNLTFLLESYEGLASYSTIAHGEDVQGRYCDVEIRSTEDFKDELGDLLQDISPKLKLRN
jgi:hypothetical protein